MSDSRQSHREPMFKAPWPATALVGVLVAAWLVQAFVLPPAWAAPLAVSLDALREGRWQTLVTHIFVHGGFTHLLLNAIAVFTFGPPVVRLLGMRNGDIALFYVFFLVCGALGALGYVLLPWNAQVAAMGASGAASGLWGGASRLLGRRGGLAPLLDRQVMLQAAGFAGVNAVIGLLGPLVGLRIGWEAHVFGYAAGLLLIGVFGRMAGRLR